MFLKIKTENNIIGNILAIEEGGTYNQPKRTYDTKSYDLAQLLSP